jgi:molybdopterin/thiamine biosynthesis adenylyltransferase
MMDEEYLKLFSRNIGIFSEEEQEKLKNASVSIAGVGGVGGIQAVTLARLGIGSIKIADPGTYDYPDFNRQYGAFMETICKNKCEVIYNTLKSINSGISAEKFEEGINENSIDKLLDGADIAIDSIEYFAPKEKILFHRKCREKGIIAITSPISGIGAVVFAFNPKGITFEEFFEAPEDEKAREKWVLPAQKISPIWPDYAVRGAYESALKGEMPLPSNGIATILSGALVSAETAFIITGKRDPVYVPKAVQLDLYRLSLDIIDLSIKR